MFSQQAKAIPNEKKQTHGKIANPAAESRASSQFHAFFIEFGKAVDCWAITGFFLHTELIVHIFSVEIRYHERAPTPRPCEL